MLESIKNWFFYREYRAVSSRRKRNVSGVNPEKTFFILFDGTSEEDRKTVHRFKKMINKDGSREVKSLAFVDNNLPLDNVDYAAYNRKNLKWYGVPFGPKIEEYLGMDFDVLIVLCGSMQPHFEYIIGLTAASFIIGPAIDKAEAYFDLIVDTGGETGLDAMIKKMIAAVDLVCVKGPARQ